MSASIPVFFLPIEKDEVPDQLLDWHDGTDLLNKYYEEGQSKGMRQATSRNWWLQQILSECCDALNIKGFEFIQADIALLKTNDLKLVGQALNSFLERFTQAKFPLNIEELHQIWFFPKGITLEDIEGMFRKAVAESEEFYDCYAGDVPDSYSGIVDFFSYVKTIKAVVKETIENEQYLLIIQPQP